MGRMIFVLNQVSQPRCIKRVETFKKNNITYEAWGFDKGLYNKNLDNQAVVINKFPYNSKGKNKVVNFIKRWKCVYDLIQNSNSKDILYFFGFDIALLGTLSLKRINYFYEESDITYARRNKVVFYILRFIDKKIRQKSLLTVFTSEGFLQYFYKNRLVPQNIIVYPNKLHYSLKNVIRKASFIDDINKLRFGFIGLIRYKTIFNFAKTIGIYFPNHEFHFWGDSRHWKEVDNIVNTYSNVFSHGVFKNPDDLSEIYSKIDVIVACYDTNNFNTKVAEPNKLYEAILFCKPIIVSKGTFLEKKVLQLGIGYSVNAQSIDILREDINKLRFDDLNKISDLQSRIGINKVIDNPESFLEKALQILASFK